MKDTPVAGDCTEGRGLAGAFSLAVSRDGRHVYVASAGSDAVAVFARNRKTGLVTQLAGRGGCVQQNPVSDDCADGVALDAAFSVAVSPDGNHVYVASAESGAVAVFARNKRTGVLTQLAGLDGCVQETPVTGECAAGEALDRADFVAVSPDGRHVYVASTFNSAVAVFARNKRTGVLTQLAGLEACVKQTPVAGDCADGKGIDGVKGLTVSPDGWHAYVASQVSSAVAVFARNRSTGALTQLAGLDGCVQDDLVAGSACADGRRLLVAHSVAVSPDGKHVYVAAHGSASVAVFARNATTGILTQPAGLDACVREAGGADACAVGRGLKGAASVAVSPNGKNVYVASNFSDAVAVFLRE